MKRIHFSLTIPALLVFLTSYFPAAAAPAPAFQQGDNPNPPDQTVKLIFIHHSTGENWLRDDYGGLGLALAENNYFVSDTNYGWGPDGIGDRTDIPNWTEWFASGQTPLYMNALFSESAQNASYTRLGTDPGGENQVVLFKSCFPNSDLEGGPDDPPAADGWLSVGHAKYVYNEILRYFGTRPDKLFVVITAPPLTSGSTTAGHAANARAFNNWLLNDWLRENNYSLKNVAVFDFYNVLTAKDAHHWVRDGQIEHIPTSRNTLYYPSGDDHPSEKGSRKATQEFLPLLNIYYHRWADWLATHPQEVIVPLTTAPTATVTPVPPVGAGGTGMLADLDGTSLAGSWWETYMGEAAGNRFVCAPAADAAYSGTNSLKADFNIAAGSWATCLLAFDSLQDWSTASGLAFYVHASRPGMPYNVLVYSGSPEAQETYVTPMESAQAGVDGWEAVNIPWSEFRRVDWEDGAGTPFTGPNQILEIGFGFDGLPEAAQAGTFWFDDIRVFGAQLPPVAPPEQAQPTSSPGGFSLPCAGSILLALGMALASWLLRRG